MVFTEVILMLVAVQNIYASSGGVYDVNWSYKTTKGLGPANWSKLVPEHCAGKRQSPVDIKVKDVIYNPALKPIVFRNYTNVFPGLSFEMGNNGHTVYAWLRYNKSYTHVPIGIEFNGETYRLAQFHFHWGKSNDRGSEHTIDGTASAGEMHVLHHNVKYKDLTSALNHRDGIIAFGNLIKVASGKDNAGIQELINHFGNVSRAPLTLTFPAVAMSTLIPSSSSDYYYYLGSLTTPSCDETITWLVNRNQIEISETQLGKFRQLYEQNKTDGKLVMVGDNFRPVQPLNGRVIKTNVGLSGADVIMGKTIVFLVSIVVMLLLK